MNKQSFMRGLLAGVAVKLACTVAFTAILLGLAKLQGHDPHWMPISADGRMQPWSAGWVVAQVLVVVGGVLAGAASARWSKADTWAAPLTLASIWFAWSVIRLQEGWPTGLAAYVVAVSPASMLLGAIAQRCRQPREGGNSAPEP